MCDDAILSIMVFEIKNEASVWLGVREGHTHMYVDDGGEARESYSRVRNTYMDILYMYFIDEPSGCTDEKVLLPMLLTRTTYSSVHRLCYSIYLKD